MIITRRDFLNTVAGCAITVWYNKLPFHLNAPPPKGTTTKVAPNQWVFPLAFPAYFSVSSGHATKNIKENKIYFPSVRS